MSFASARLPGFAAAALIALAVPVHAENAAKPNYPAVPLIATGKTTIGETIRYPQGEAHITASIVTLAPGARTIAHRHGVPMFAYILEGEITVDYGAHGKRTYRKGDALMEAMDAAHFGENTGSEPMRLIAIYMGSSAAKNVMPAK